MQRVTNTTHFAKAVRVVGGHTVVKPGATVSVDMQWPEDERQRYIAAGLTMAEGGNTARPAEAYAVRDKGRGWYVIMQGDEEVTKSLREDSVIGFADLTADEQAAFVAEHAPD